MSDTLNRVNRLVEYIEKLESKYRDSVALNSQLKSKADDVELENLSLSERLEELQNIATNRDDKLVGVMDILSSLVDDKSDKSVEESNEIQESNNGGEVKIDQLKSHFSK
jgi:hypothetical protein